MKNTAPVEGYRRVAKYAGAHTADPHVRLIDAGETSGETAAVAGVSISALLSPRRDPRRARSWMIHGVNAAPVALAPHAGRDTP